MAFYLQMQDSRTHFQDEMVLTNHRFDLKKKETYGKKSRKTQEKKGLSQLVLIVNNWAFVRDNQDKADVENCALKDFQVQLKLSSSAFRGPNNSDKIYAFDRNGASFPLYGFMQLLKSATVQKFVANVKQLFEKFEGPFPEEEQALVEDLLTQEVGMVIRETEESEGEEEEDYEDDGNQFSILPEKNVQKKGGRKRGRPAN